MEMYFIAFCTVASLLSVWANSAVLTRMVKLQDEICNDLRKHNNALMSWSLDEKGIGGKAHEFTAPNIYDCGTANLDEKGGGDGEG